MARGYSANRSTSSRPTLKAKRKRSVSIQRLRDSIDSKSRSSSTASTGRDEAQEVPRLPVRRVIRAVRVEKLGVKTPVPETVPAAAKAEDEEVTKQESKDKDRPRTKSEAKRAPSNSVFLAQKLAKEHMEDLEASEDEAETTRRQDVLSKYKTAGKLLDEIMVEVVAKCVVGANTHTICTFGDDQLYTRTKGIFHKARAADGTKVTRGIAFPCNVSVNHVLCNHSPVTAEEGVTLARGDVVKIHMGLHVDGYPVTEARTIIVAAGESSSTGEAEFAMEPSAARAIEAARVSLDAMIHYLRPGVENADITDQIARVGNHFEVEAVEGVLSNRTKRWISDSMEAIITRRVTREDPQQDVAAVTIKPFQVWTLDVAFTNAPTYKMSIAPGQVNLFRKNEMESNQDLRSTAAAEFLNEIRDQFFCFPFHARHASQPNKARLAISILRKNNLIDELVALQCKPNANKKNVTARFSATVAVTDKRVIVLCGLPPSQPLDYGATSNEIPSVPPDVAALLNEPLIFSASDKTTEKRSKKKARTEQSATTTSAANEEEATS
eukprot:CAMPEP_0176423080 /NCGR_PEP_ID=MMETSP0127-20121128/10083_1 /TAXON_ID=938130 /ORGANISM="Platyophrya macrostoma, Strain WH" /LENGTH=551 /DNA_ID=CAMNT_0017803987 /DNA_START=37 /DNA_END=1692 /DNA_ORIENTATION=+